MRGITAGISANLTQLAPKDKIETTHLRMLKWIMGVHKKTTNNACYGDTGRIPLALSVISQCCKYFVRASEAAGEGSVNTLLHHTFQEQKALNMEWYCTWYTIINSNHQAPPSDDGDTGELFARTFRDQWKSAITSQNKLHFYSSIKQSFGQEPYLALPHKGDRDSLARLRTSSHDLRIEKGRYSKTSTFLSRACRFCTFDEDTAALFSELPFPVEPIIESEEHALTECPGYHHLRLSLSDDLKSALMRRDYMEALNSPLHLEELANFTRKCYLLRNPKRSNAQEQ